MQHCIAAMLLVSLVGLHTFDQFAAADAPIATVDDVTDEIVQKWLEFMVTESNLPTMVKGALSEVKFIFDRNDPQGCVLKFFSQIFVKLEENGCDSVIKNRGKELASKSPAEVGIKDSSGRRHE